MTISRLFFLFSNVCVLHKLLLYKAVFPQAVNKEILLAGGVSLKYKRLKKVI